MIETFPHLFSSSGLLFWKQVISQTFRRAARFARSQPRDHNQGHGANHCRSKAMKCLPIAAFTILLSTTAAMAGAGAPVPEGSQNPPPSGRPSAALDDVARQEGWKMASTNAHTLSKDKATPFVVNYQMVDTDKDGKISAAEFTAGCGKGGNQTHATSTVKDLKHQH